MSFFTETEKQFKQAILSYDTCKDIYRTSVMGKRIVEALVNFSMSAERELSIQKAPPEAVDQFKLVAKQLKQKEAIKRTIYNARIYGTGALYVALHNMITDKDDFDTKPNFNNAEDFDICFNVLDPQNISGSVVDNNPLSFTFLQLINIKVDNQLVPRKRIAISHAVEPLYLDQRTSLISYSPPSVFYNMVDLLKDYDAAIEALDNLLYKAGAIIYKYPNQKFSGITLDVIKKSAEILEQKQNGNVIAISDKCTIEDFPINNVNGLIESVNKLEDAITKALNDTPASLLFDKSLSNGFSEGDKDKETEISIIEAFRENKLAPLYNLTDYYVMLKAFDNNFINEMKDKYNDFKDKTNAQIFYDWVNSFKYEFGNLFPEPESIKIDNNTKKLDNLLKLKELGANLSDIEAELNEDEIFKQEIDLDGEAPTFTEGEQSLDEDDDLENEDLEDNKIDTNMYRFIDNGNVDNNDNKTDDKKAFDESKIKRDKDGKFAKKNESGDGKKDSDKKDNDKKAEPKDDEDNSDKQKDNSTKKSNCEIGDVINTPFYLSPRNSIETKKIAENDNYELYEENTKVFENLNKDMQNKITEALHNVSEKYDELFNIYGKSDSQPTNKLKIVLLDQKKRAELDTIWGFVYTYGAEDENKNAIYINTTELEAEGNDIKNLFIHETIHTITNDNLRNGKTKKLYASDFEEALAESAVVINDENYRNIHEVDEEIRNEEVRAEIKLDRLLDNKYIFATNLMRYLYLKNNKNSDIFKNIINNENTTMDKAIQTEANKIGIEGKYEDIIKDWMKEFYGANDIQANHYYDIYKNKRKKWRQR